MGRYKDPNSRRSRQAAAREARLAAVDANTPAATPPGLSAVPGTGSALPRCPEWATDSVKDIFASIVSDLVAAKVPLKRIDAHGILMMAQGIDGVREASVISEDPDADAGIRMMALKLKQQYGRDLIQWVPLMAACPIGRARLGQKPEPEHKAGPLQHLLASRLVKRA